MMFKLSKQILKLVFFRKIKNKEWTLQRERQIWRERSERKLLFSGRFYEKIIFFTNKRRLHLFLNLGLLLKAPFERLFTTNYFTVVI